VLTCGRALTISQRIGAPCAQRIEETLRGPNLPESTEWPAARAALRGVMPRTCALMAFGKLLQVQQLPPGHDQVANRQPRGSPAGSPHDNFEQQTRGGVQSFSRQNGSLQHSFWTDPAGQVGASVWSSEAATKGWVWVTTGDPEFTGTRLYHAYSVLRLNSSTLALSGSWQLKLPQAADLDFGSSPTLFPGIVHGVSTALVTACNKNGRYYALRRDDLGLGPVWSVRIGAAAHTHQGMCLASAVWNAQASALYLAGNATSIGGHTYDGSVREVSAGTGATKWATRLSCGVLGTPALDAATSVLAVATLGPCANGSPAVYLLNARTGRILATLPLNVGGFAQPVFAGQYLLVADESGQVVAYSPAAAAGHARCTGWCSARHRRSPLPPTPVR